MSSRGGFLTVMWLALGLGLAERSTLAMQPISGTDTPAHRTAARLMRGVNFGNYLEYAVGNPAADSTYTEADFTLARSEGFDHIRLPVAWALYCGPAPGFTISADIFKKVDTMVAWALKHQLAIIVDVHHFNAFTADPASNTDQFYAIWEQVAAHFANASSQVVFELLNEPFGAATTPIMNQVAAESIRRIRLTNPNRTILVPPGDYDSALELSKLVLPDNDANLIATIHCYDPYYFTHQGAEWAYPDTRTTGVLFPGPPPSPLAPDPSIKHDWVITWFQNYNRLTSQNPSSPAAFVPIMQRAKNWSSFYGRPVHVGEFGCYYKADPDSRVNFYRSIRETMDTLGLGWTMWDWKSGFHYIANGAPQPAGMRAAMFPAPVLNVDGVGTLTSAAAIGKVFVVEKATSLVAPVGWQSVSTQTLTSPQFSFTDPAPSSSGGYYRLRWLK